MGRVCHVPSLLCAELSLKSPGGTVGNNRLIRQDWSTVNDRVDSAHSIHKISSIDHYYVDPFNVWFWSRVFFFINSWLCRSTDCRSYRLITINKSTGVFLAIVDCVDQLTWLSIVLCWSTDCRSFRLILIIGTIAGGSWKPELIVSIIWLSIISIDYDRCNR